MGGMGVGSRKGGGGVVCCRPRRTRTVPVIETPAIHRKDARQICNEHFASSDYSCLVPCDARCTGRINQSAFRWQLSLFSIFTMREAGKCRDQSTSPFRVDRPRLVGLFFFPPSVASCVKTKQKRVKKKREKTKIK